MKNDNVIIFLDNAYLKKVSFFYGKKNHLDFDIKKFAILLAKENKLFCKKIYLYDAPPFGENIRLEKYKAFLSYLKKRGIIVREGRCQKIGNEYHQKGVDTLITMDLLKCAFEHQSDNFIIITADTDFVPVIKEVKEKGIKIILYCLQNRNRKFFLSNHLLDICDQAKLIKEEHFI
jgi:uncharacterized LabA/DUF88 family protein